MEILAIIGTVVAMLGVVLIYDARQIAKKIFSFGDQNEATKAMKVTGFIMSIIGSLLIML